MKTHFLLFFFYPWPWPPCTSPSWSSCARWGRAMVGYDGGGDGGLTVQMQILFPSWLNRHFLPFFLNTWKHTWHFFISLTNDHGLYVQVLHEEGGVDGGVVQMLILFPSWLHRHTWKHIFCLFFISLTMASMYKSIIEFMRKMVT